MSWLLVFLICKCQQRPESLKEIVFIQGIQGSLISCWEHPGEIKCQSRSELGFLTNRESIHI